MYTHVQQWEMFPKIGREGGLEWEWRDGEKEGWRKGGRGRVEHVNVRATVEWSAGGSGGGKGE